MLRTPTPSFFRPRKAVDQRVLTQNRTLVHDINRRSLKQGVKGARLGGIFNMGGAAVANYVSILERLR